MLKRFAFSAVRFSRRCSTGNSGRSLYAQIRRGVKSHFTDSTGCAQWEVRRTLAARQGKDTSEMPEGVPEGQPDPAPMSEQVQTWA